MKAVFATKYGSPDVLEVKEIDKPKPKDNEVLVKIHATPVNFGDMLARNFAKITPRTFSMPGPLWYVTRPALGIRKPRQPILGSEFAGVVEAVGKDVTRFKPGDAIFGYPGMNFGAHAEYLCMPEKGIMAPLPANTTYEQAATFPYGGMTALNLLTKMDIKPGQKVLINGASGGIGAPAVQIAKHHFGAEVTGVCGTPRLEYVKALGADHVIDYTQEDFTQNGETYDLIMDIRGKLPFAHCKNSLAPGGRLLYVSFKTKHLMQMLWGSLRGSKKRVVCLLAPESNEALAQVKDLIEAGKLTTIIDRCYPLEQAADAHHYIESGAKRGQVVITVA